MSGYKYIFEPYTQTPDSVSVNTVQEPDTTNSNNASFGFSLERQTLVSTESADTIKDIKPLPQTLRQYREVVVVQKDTLKYERYYFTHIKGYEFNKPECFLNQMPCYKPSADSKINIEKYVSKQVVSHKTTNKNNSENEHSTNVNIENKIEKEQNQAAKTTEVITVEPKKNETVEKTEFQIGDWIIGVVLFSAFIFAWIKMFYNRNYKNILKSGFNYQYAYKLVKEGNSISYRVNTFLNFVFYINFAMFIFISVKLFGYNIEFQEWKFYLFIFALLLIIYTGKTFVFNILGFVFNSKSAVNEYVINIGIYNKIIGIFLFPIIIAIPYIALQFKLPLMYIGIGAIILSLIFRFLRAFQIAFKIKLSIFYMILYLCALEILPILIIGKMINNIVG